jgi:protein-L-isoaspartate(D-aspartate) O-methyltransferase
MAQRLGEGRHRPSRASSQAFASVPRHHFVDAALATQAYEDTSLPIGHGRRSRSRRSSRG